MISKVMLRVDIIGQIFITAASIFSLIIEPSAIMIIGLMFLFWIGIWQLFLGLLEAVFYKNETRKKYFFAAIAFIGSMFILGAVNSWFSVKMNSEFLAYLTGIYIFGGATAFAVWYFRQTILDLNRQEITRTFWDLEF